VLFLNKPYMTAMLFVELKPQQMATSNYSTSTTENICGGD